MNKRDKIGNVGFFILSLFINGLSTVIMLLREKKQAK